MACKILNDRTVLIRKISRSDFLRTLRTESAVPRKNQVESFNKKFFGIMILSLLVYFQYMYCSTPCTSDTFWQMFKS